KVAGYSLGEADLLRRAMGKKKKEILDEAYGGFAEGMTKNGFSQAAITALWDTVLPFAGYAFNKSHAAGYGLVSFWTAYLKANYPAEYMAGLLTSVGDDKDKSAIYLADCRKMGITVLPPDVNESRADFAAVGDDIRFGLAAIRNVGSGVVSSIIASREEKGAFNGFSDYLGKIDVTACNKKVTESLIKAGAFDSLDHPRKGLFLVHADAVDSVLGTKKAEAIGQFDLFGDMGGGDEAISEVFAVKVPDEEWESKHKLALERDMLGLYVSGHPLAGVEHALAAQTDTSITQLLEDQVKDGAHITIGGIISSVTRRVNKKGEPWAAVTVEDMVGGVEVYFFPRAYVAFGMDLTVDNIVLVKARVNKRDDSMMISANDLAVPDLSAVGTTKPLNLTLQARACTPSKVASLKQVLQRHAGTSDVHVTLVSDQKQTRLLLTDALRVTPSSALMGDLKALLGPSCLS
ncbi:OB-fold nucleic acid binding domain-containing protein, partial [Gordonia sp. (in: high G+C Gram-positive bacteria)]|uniref:helix-hairpin-helix domain-containing protein n=1 Tax=Gordonia sp. (in: high G+C Gram-positive bacteria) TaxID=84139 RepID=UPI00169B9946|nr:DNA polymerase III subunit alpha [Gordonia sp. (in: high G+C Gram-positive bacteria)]